MNVRVMAAALAAAAAAGCASTTASAPGGAASPVPAAAVNPVAVVRAAGAVPAAGQVQGDHDIYGDRLASGSFPGGEMITVYTAADQAAFQAEAMRPPVDDSHGVVTIPAELAVIAVDAGGQPSGWGGPTPGQIAARVGGQVMPAG